MDRRINQTLGKMLIAVALCMFELPVLAETAYVRLSDKNVVKLADSLEDKVKRFERALDSKIKRSVLRGSGGEVQIPFYLEDLEDDIKKLKKRYSGEYAASAEAQSLLQRAGLMHGYLQENPGVKGANEWDILAAGLQELASSYGTDFPLVDGAVVRRVGDKELANVSKELYDASRKFSSKLAKSTSRIKPLKETVSQARDELETLGDASKNLSSRVRSNDPATAQARQVIAAAKSVESTLDVDGMPEEVMAEWESVRQLADKVAQAFWL